MLTRIQRDEQIKNFRGNSQASYKRTYDLRIYKITIVDVTKVLHLDRSLAIPVGSSYNRKVDFEVMKDLIIATRIGAQI